MRALPLAAGINVGGHFPLLRQYRPHDVHLQLKLHLNINTGYVDCEPFIKAIWSPFYQTGPYSAKIIV